MTQAHGICEMLGEYKWLASELEAYARIASTIPRSRKMLFSRLPSALPLS